MYEIVQGDSDSDTVRPGDGVNRVEFLKMFMKAAILEENDFEVESCTEAPYSDIEEEKWFSNYVCTEKKLDLFDTYDDLFLPANGATRAEVAEAIYRFFE